MWCRHICFSMRNFRCSIHAPAYPFYFVRKYITCMHLDDNIWLKRRCYVQICKMANVQKLMPTACSYQTRIKHRLLELNFVNLHICTFSVHCCYEKNFNPARRAPTHVLGRTPQHDHFLFSYCGSRTLSIGGNIYLPSQQEKSTAAMSVWLYFILTLALELPIVLLFFRKQWKFALLIGFLLNLLTWPLLHVLVYYSDININILEVGVAIVEGIGYCIFMKTKWYKGFAVSFLANGFSYGAGLLINLYLL